VRRHYGIEVDISIFRQIIVFARDGRPYVLPQLDLDDELSPTVLRDLCSIFNLPAADFSLDPDDD
jgi:hypothetical protein